MIATRNLLYVYVIVSFSYVMWQRHEPYRLGRGWSNGLGSDSHMIFESDVATWISKGIRISLRTVHIGKTNTMWNIWFLYVNNVLLLTANNNRGRTNIFLSATLKQWTYLPSMQYFTTTYYSHDHIVSDCQKRNVSWVFVKII